MSKHTPGPWIMIPDFPKLLGMDPPADAEPEGGWGYVIDSKQEQDKVGWRGNAICHLPGDASFYNACLIKEAPKMLDELKNVFDSADVLSGGGATVHLSARDMKSIQKILRGVKGKK